MATRNSIGQAREVLDRRLTPLQPATQFAPPRLGWIRAIRDALGMSAAELATRMGISGASVRSLEQKELTGGIRVSSLRRAAEAMDCTLVYAFVPNTSLDATVRRQAQRVLDEQIGRTRQTMALEAQEGEVRASAVDAQLDSIIGSARLWSGRGTKR
ncbi:MAG: mobile mystery protein A [Coriobacteriia bacterium]|nr:mobile mystery protein A [Coriobacteriia bacterium]